VLHSPRPPNVLLVEDDPHFAQWVQATLHEQAGDLSVFVSHNLATARRAWSATPQCWRLVVVDLHLGAESGVDLIRELALQAPTLPLLVITSVAATDKALQAIRAGAQGYILKSTIDHELLRAVRQVLDGGSPITPSIARLLLGEFRQQERIEAAEAHEPAGTPSTPPAGAMPAAVEEKLSQREAEVLRLIARGYTDKEVAARLEISPATVDTHVRKIYRKLSINSRVELRRLLD
jgi:DNA-binding NarL/FixJ family response regulator